jgi:hypothetical protein
MKSQVFFIKIYSIGFLAFACLTSCNNPAHNTERKIEKKGFVSINSTSKETGFISLFDGNSLAGWEGDSTYWRVEGGNIVGEITPETILKNNSFLIWKGGEPSDFELKLEVSITKNGNSGINYRSERFTELPFALRGYQADIDGKNSYTGQNYEERKRTTLAYIGQKTTIDPQTPAGELRDNIERNAWKGLRVTEELGDADSLRKLIKSEDWNMIHLVVQGNVMKHFVNGVLISEVVDQDTVNRSMRGLLGIQVHVGPPMQVKFRNIQLKEL